MEQIQSWVSHLHVQISGPEDAEPVLLLHGWGSNAGLMQLLANALQDKYRVYNIDLPGHGQTPLPPEPWGVPEHAQLVAAFISEEVKQPVHVVGHSNGGRISLFMSSTPELAGHIHSLSLVSPSGVKAKRSLKYHLKSTTGKLLKAPFQLLPPALKQYGLDWLRHTLVWRLISSSDYSQLQGVMREVFVKTVNCYLDNRLQHIQKPLLLFWGTEDTAISRYQMDVMLNKVAGSDMVILEGAGHYGYVDQPQKVIPALRYFLDAHKMELSAH